MHYEVIGGKFTAVNSVLHIILVVADGVLRQRFRATSAGPGGAGGQSLPLQVNHSRVRLKMRCGSDLLSHLKKAPLSRSQLFLTTRIGKGRAGRLVTPRLVIMPALLEAMHRCV